MEREGYHSLSIQSTNPSASIHREEKETIRRRVAVRDGFAYKKSIQCVQGRLVGWYQVTLRSCYILGLTGWMAAEIPLWDRIVLACSVRRPLFFANFGLGLFY